MKKKKKKELEQWAQTTRSSVLACVRVCVCGGICVCSLSHVWLFVTPWTVAHQAPLSVGILQARTVEWVAMPSSRGSCRPRDQTLCHLCLLHCRWILYHWATWEAPHLVWGLLQKISLHSDFSAETMSARCQRHPDGSGGLSHQHRLPLRCCLVETASTDLWGLEQWPGKTPEGRNTANVCLN